MEKENIYKLKGIKKNMKLLIDIPDYLNRMLKIEKAKNNFNYLQEVVIKILEEYYKEWSQKQ